jgi:class 3 adenylate cyclase
MLLAEAYLAQDDPDDAELELRAALHAFEQLGARPDAERARSALRRVSTRGDRDRGARRVTRAFVFTDVVASTPLVAALGDHAWQQLLQWHDRVLREIFREHDGHEIDHPGDGFFVAFDGADDALCCAQDIQRRLERHRRDAGFAPQVRVGVHVDEAMQVEDGYRGHGVHVAARIGAQAAGGEILVSRQTLEAAESDFAAGEARSVDLKGVDHPVAVAPLLWS